MARPRDAPGRAVSGWKRGWTSSLRRVGALQGIFNCHFLDDRRIAVGRNCFIVDQRQLLARALGLTLPVPHAGVEPAACQQLVVGAALDDRPLVEHDDLISADDSREPVRDDERRAVARNTIEGILDFFFGVAVERRCRFIEQQDRRGFENASRYGYPLLLSA